MVSIDDVARAAGVSTATVSRALSGRGHVSPVTRARVRAAAEVLGYVVSASASSLASGRARNIGVLLPYVDRWFFSTVLAGIAAELMRGGYDITLYSVTDDPVERRRVFETFVRRQRVDGVICVSIALEEEETRRLAELGLPLVALGGPHAGMTTLMVDDVAIGRFAAEHLLSLGHRRIAHIGARPEFDLDFHVPAQRRRGFEQALQDAAVPARADLFEPADFTVAGGHRAATRLLGAGRVPPAGRLMETGRLVEARADRGRRFRCAVRLGGCAAMRVPAPRLRLRHGRPRRRRSWRRPTRWRSARCSPHATWGSGCRRMCRSSAWTDMNWASSSA